MYYCEPAWHNGDKNADANFLVLSPEDDRGKAYSGFSCCERHLVNAIEEMLGRFRFVIVRRVSNTTASEQARRRL